MTRIRPEFLLALLVLLPALSCEQGKNRGAPQGSNKDQRAIYELAVAACSRGDEHARRVLSGSADGENAFASLIQCAREVSALEDLFGGLADGPGGRTGSQLRILDAVISNEAGSKGRGFTAFKTWAIETDSRLAKSLGESERSLGLGSISSDLRIMNSTTRQLERSEDLLVFKLWARDSASALNAAGMSAESKQLAANLSAEQRKLATTYLKLFEQVKGQLQQLLDETDPLAR